MTYEKIDLINKSMTVSANGYSDRYGARGVEFVLHLSKPGDSNLQAFDISGRKVWSYEQSQAIAGTHRITWDGRDKHSELVPDGIYLIRISTNNMEKKTRLILVK